MYGYNGNSCTALLPLLRTVLHCFVYVYVYNGSYIIIYLLITSCAECYIELYPSTTETTLPLYYLLLGVPYCFVSCMSITGTSLPFYYVPREVFVFFVCLSILVRTDILYEFLWKKCQKVCIVTGKRWCFRRDGLALHCTLRREKGRRLRWWRCSALVEVCGLQSFARVIIKWTWARVRQIERKGRQGHWNREMGDRDSAHDEWGGVDTCFVSKSVKDGHYMHSEIRLSFYCRWCTSQPRRHTSFWRCCSSEGWPWTGQWMV